MAKRAEKNETAGATIVAWLVLGLWVACAALAMFAFFNYFPGGH